MSHKTEMHEVIVVGGGFAGIGAVIKLREAGIDDVVLLEKASELGGVWRDNTYPGCACDVPSALYSFSFAPNPSWSRVFAGQAEIKAYLQGIAETYCVLPVVKFQHEVMAATWSDSDASWRIQTNHGDFFARSIIMAGGPMHEPVLPNVPGLNEFPGEVFHSSRWRHDIDLRNKRVAVIGTGASAIQFVPAIQPEVGHLTVFQRTPHWVLPKIDQTLPSLIKRVFKRLPLAQLVVRGAVFGLYETLNGGMQNIAAMKQFQRLATFNLHRAVKDPAVRRRLTPRYTIGCKRILQSNDWYPALVQPNVEVVSSALAAVKGSTLIAADGSTYEADIIILGTGFEIAEPPIAKRVLNRHGQRISDVWQGSPEGYMGTMVADCPNAFLMFGPNIAVSSSAFLIIEAQLTYIVDAIKKLRTLGLSSVETDPLRVADFNARVQSALENSVWNRGGCTSYFIDRNGRNSTVWPWSTLEMKRQLGRFNLDEYRVVHA